MKDELIKLLRRAEKDKPYPDELAEEIMYLIAPELEKARILNDKIGHLVATDIAVLVEKARKWDRVKSYIAGECTLCPACTACMSVNYCVLNNVEYAILTEKEPT